MRELLLLFFFISLSLSADAQTTGFGYQAVIRNNTGEILLNREIKATFKIHKEKARGEVVYSEEAGGRTNENGLFTVEIGKNTQISENDFSSIDWGASDAYFLEVRVDEGSAYIPSSTQQLLSVPMAQYADVTEAVCPTSGEGKKWLISVSDNGEIGTEPVDDIRKSGNPIFPGWYADPHAVIYGDTYWVYSTISDFQEKQGVFDCFSSHDLVNWTKHSSVLDIKDVAWGNVFIWAPSAIENNGKYYLFFSADDKRIGVSVADRPEGPYKDLIGKPLISETINGAHPIDQFVMKDDDGNFYMYYGGWGHCNVVKLKDDFTGIIPFPDGELYKEVTPDGYTEGVFVIKRNGEYIIMWSAGNWMDESYSVSYATGKSITGPFEKKGVILHGDKVIANGTGHHAVINIPGTDDWYIFYHRRPITETLGNSRETCIEVMKFISPNTNLIRPVKMTREGVERRILK